MTLKLDQTNRVVVPESLSERLGLKPGDVVDVTLAEDSIVIRPAGHGSTLVEKEGVLVCSSEWVGSASDLDHFIDQQRVEHFRRLGGI